jgi:hypothetical protein
LQRRQKRFSKLMSLASQATIRKMLNLRGQPRKYVGRFTTENQAVL